MKIETRQLTLRRTDAPQNLDSPSTKQRSDDSTPDTSLRIRAQSLPERCVQFTGAMIGLILLSPLLTIIGILIKMTGRGPILYRGERVGKLGKPFYIYKFRTLQVDAESKIGARLLTRSDNYYTHLGKFLKKTKLDELPQLINVIKGDMNLVGPRPIRPIFLNQFDEQIPNYRLRFLLKPGITGLAQVRGTYYTHPRAKLRYELFYAKHRSFLMDIKLVALTFFKILNRWATLGVLLFFLFLFVSFVPPDIQERMYIHWSNVHVNILHILVLCLGFWLVVNKIPSHRLYLYRNRLNCPIACFLIVGVVSALFSEEPGEALRGVMYYFVTGFFISLLIINTPITKTFLRTGAKVVALSCVTISVIGLARVVLVGNVRASGKTIVELQGTMAGDGIVSTLGSPLALAMYLILGIPFVLTQITHAQQREVRDFWVVCATMALIGILLTKSLIGLAALLITIGVYTRTYLRFRLSNSFIFVLAVTVTCLSLWVNLSYRIDLPTVGNIRSDFAVIIENTPTLKILVGLGPRTLNDMDAASDMGAKTAVPAYILQSGHLRLILENGVIGWLIFLWAVVAVIRTILRAERTTVLDDYTKGILWAAFSAIVGFTIALIGFNAFASMTLQLFFWSLIGTAVAITIHQTGKSDGFRILWRFGNE